MGRHPKWDGMGDRQYVADRSPRTWNESPDLISISALARPGKGFLLCVHLVFCVISEDFSSLAPVHDILKSVLPNKRPDSSGVHQIKEHSMEIIVPEQPPLPPLKPRLWQPSWAKSAWPWPPLLSHNSERGTVHLWIENASISFNSAISTQGVSEWARVVKICLRSWGQAVGEENSLKGKDKTASGRRRCINTGGKESSLGKHSFLVWEVLLGCVVYAQWIGMFSSHRVSSKLRGCFLSYDMIIRSPCSTAMEGIQSLL